MKPEPTAVPNQAFQNVREVEAHSRARMDKVLTGLEQDMASIRTGRASVGIFDNVKVDYYGTPTPLNQLSNLHVPEPTLITIQPWDVSQIAAIEKAIRGSDLGLNPAEDHRVALRNLRRDANEHLKKLLKDKLISEDDE